MKMGIRHFSQSVPANGTRVQLSTSNITVEGITIQAKLGNTGQVFVGGDQVSATNCFLELNAEDVVTINGAMFGMAGAKIQLNDFWIDVGTNDDAVWVGYMVRVDS